MIPARLVDAAGNRIEVANELGRGGEGAVFDVAGRSDTVAKLYLKPPTAQLAAKLSAMAGMASGPLRKVTAWPTGTLHDPSGQVVGFTMPKVGGHKPIFQLYLPKPRLRNFPTADWRFLIHAAANTARAFEAVHAAGLVIGDVNHGNLVVADDATVQMIDCDSFQVSAASQTWFCTVGVGTHQPPEMQGLDSYANVPRTPNHDSFGLAVILFQLLCIARHPFAGRFLGPGDPPSIEEAITASRYAYSRDQSRTQMEVPPGSLPIEALSPEIRDLFEKAFSPGSTLGGRPRAEHWAPALGALAGELKPCRANGAHFFRREMHSCPWCAIEGASGITLFPVVFVPGSAGERGMAALWQEVISVPKPSGLGQWPVAAPSGGKPSADALKAVETGQSLRRVAWASVIAALATTIIMASPGARVPIVTGIGAAAFAILQIRGKRGTSPFRQRLTEVSRDWEALHASWTSQVTGPTFQTVRGDLLRLKVDHNDLPAERARRLQALQAQRHSQQLQAHLDGCLLARAVIPYMGPAKIATLASYGIDCAGDIVASKVLAIPGFGPSNVAKLVSWRHVQEQLFRFDPNQAVPASETAAVERFVADQKNRLEREMEAGLHRLRVVAAATEARNQALHRKLAELGPHFSRAVADDAIVPEDRQASYQMITLSVFAVILSLVSSLGTTQAPKPRQQGPVQSQPLPQEISPSTSNPAVSLPLPALAQAVPPLVSTHATGLAPIQPVQTAQPVTTGTPTAREGERVIVSQAGNIRFAPKANASVVRIVGTGISLRVFARSVGWLQVGEDEPWGWIFSGLVKAVP